MKNEKGITLTSLVIYIIALTIIVIMFGVMRNNFENSVKDISQESNLESEFNKFNLYFTKDIKIEGNKAVLDGQNKITFSSGSSYEFINEEKNVVYKNSDKEIKILRNVNSCTFATTIDTDTAKTIITVSILFEGADSAITKEYVLLEKEDIGYQNEEEYITITPPATRLPDGYTEVEYIESTGTQYIDTGIYATNKTLVNAKLYTENNGNRNWFGGSAYTDNNNFVFNSYSQKKLEYEYGSKNWYVSDVEDSIVGEIFTIKYGNGVIKINDKKIVDLPTDSFVDTLTLTIFDRNGNGGYIDGRLYYFKIYEGNSLVRDFIPVLDNNNVACLYDKVEEKTYYNKGTGTFIAELVEKVPNEYKAIEYIEGTGTQYIDTGINATNKTLVNAKLYTQNTGNKNWFGGSGYSGNYNYVFNSYNQNTFEIRYGSGNWQTLYSSDSIVGEIFIVKYGDGIIRINNKNISNLSTTTFVDTQTITIFVRNGGFGYIDGRIYYFQIYKDNMLLRNLLPCIRKSDNVAGLYDTVNGVFYTNIGTGSFVTGPEI